ncbi:hypothetical protein TRICI_004066 [Trichomonascus ciferrii]|uniref:Uncharacterized protein n=1 Tax=Trichomonascus ciferrii TaxID=44093 RepID=A0A642V1Z0_9ASCO|nr:hypothetical protein TRICI_004066 [Trichomonascus ciferrii]
MESIARSDIGVSPSFKRNYYKLSPREYTASNCPPTIIEVAWTQSMNNVQAKVERWHHYTKLQCEVSVIFCLNFGSMDLVVQVLDFTFRSLVQVAHEASCSFDTVNRVKFFRCLRSKAEEQKNLTRDFQMCLINMKNSSSFEEFSMAHFDLGYIRAQQIYSAYSSDVESYLNDANDYLLEIEGSMNEMSGNLSPDAQSDWKLSQNEKANMDDFEKCVQLMKGYTMLDKRYLRDIYCEVLEDYVDTLWRLPISYTDLTSEGLKWHMNLRGLEALPEEGDQDIYDRLRAYDRLSESVEDYADIILVSCADGDVLRVPRLFGKIGNLHYMMVRSCEQVKIDKLRLISGVFEDNGVKKEDLFERVVRAAGTKSWEGIDVYYRP